MKYWIQCINTGYNTLRHYRVCFWSLENFNNYPDKQQAYQAYQDYHHAEYAEFSRTKLANLVVCASVCILSVWMCICLLVYICVCMCVFVCTCVSVCRCVYLSVCLYVFIYLCMYANSAIIWLHKQAMIEAWSNDRSIDEGFRV